MKLIPIISYGIEQSQTSHRGFDGKRRPRCDRKMPTAKSYFRRLSIAMIPKSKKRKWAGASLIAFWNWGGGSVVTIEISWWAVSMLIADLRLKWCNISQQVIEMKYWQVYRNDGFFPSTPDIGPAGSAEITILCRAFNVSLLRYAWRARHAMINIEPTWRHWRAYGVRTWRYAYSIRRAAWLWERPSILLS